jgi:hypothetical protein
MDVGAGANETGPFGNPDGARATLNVVLRDFVEFDGRSGFGALATRAEDASVRVIVGKLGAGKTVYLRRLQSFQADQPAVYADTPQQSLPSTELIVKACQWYAPDALTEKWMQIWNRSILRSLATHLLFDDRLMAYVDDETRTQLNSYGQLIGEAKRPRSIYSQLRAILNSTNTGIHLTRYLEDDRWDDLEYDLGKALRNAPPIFFYLDAVDEEFHHAPMYWLRCQKGLFYQTMRLLRDARLGGRLHIVICIRDIVMSSVYRSEHAPRYHGEEHIRVLTWDADALRYLLEEKISRLRAEFKMVERSEDPSIEGWLGSQWIHNERRGLDEALEDYLLRHTRLIPRDIVSMGNALSSEVVKQKLAGRSELPPEIIRETVSRAAKRFADSQLAQCANQLAADSMPRHAVLKDYSETYIASQEYAEGIREDIKAVLAQFGCDRFDADALEFMTADARRRLQDESVHLDSILWQNGLLGFTRGDRDYFYSLDNMDQFNIPREVDGYVLHPCVLDAVPGLRGSGPPVRPFYHS